MTVITLSGRESDFFTLPPTVGRIALDLVGGDDSRIGAAVRVARRVLAFRRAIRSVAPDIVVSFLDVVNVLVLLATRGSGIPVVVSERIDPRVNPLARSWRVLQEWTYRWAQQVVVQTDVVARGWAQPKFGAHRVSVIPNPHDMPSPNGAAPPRSLTVVGVGRLVPQKGFDVLIEAFARVAPKHPRWSLEIHGEGTARDALEAQAARTTVPARISLPGRSQDIAGKLSTAGIFVLSSRYEGFPNALLEAMAAGAPVVSTDCPSGPSDLVCPSENGLLVPVDDVAAMAACLDHLMEDEALRQRLGNAARATSVAYALPAVTAQWEATFLTASAKGCT